MNVFLLGKKGSKRWARNHEIGIDYCTFMSKSKLGLKRAQNNGQQRALYQLLRDDMQ